MLAALYPNLDTVQALDPITGQYMSYKPLFHRQWDKGGSGTKGAVGVRVPTKSYLHQVRCMI